MRIRVSLAMCVIVVGSMVTAAAGEPSRELAAIRVTADTQLDVRTAAGAEIKGRFVRVSRQSLVITTPDGREIVLAAPEVALVWRRGDRLRNGAIIGGLIGLAGGVAGQSNCTDCAGQVAIGIGLGVPIWAGIGAFIDRQHVGRTLIYQAP